MKRRAVVLLATSVALTACGDQPVPKPRGYFRLDLSARSYEPWSDGGAFHAEIPVYASIALRKEDADARWYDLRFPAQRATVHLTWSPVKDDLASLIDDAHTFKDKHQMMADRIGRERVRREEARVFGTIFDVDGDAASPCVFYLTDSTANFLYGALYFDARPNGDSLAPVTERIREDLRHFTGTLRWGADD